MKKSIKVLSLKLLGLIIGVGALTSCISDKDSPGLEFMPDMYRSPSIEPYVDYGWIKDREVKEATLQLSAMHPPLNTVPYHGGEEDWIMELPYHRAAGKFAPETHGLKASDGWLIGTTALGDYYTAAEDKNPIVLTAENEKDVLKQGKKLYEINCVHCHGEKGDGKGTIVTNGSYAGVPDYHNLTSLADGQIFYSIYYGKGMMGAHASLLTNKDIWTLVHYVNHFRFKDYGAGYVVTTATTAADQTTETTEE